jgi:hypothetical protein
VRGLKHIAKNFYSLSQVTLENAQNQPIWSTPYMGQYGDGLGWLEATDQWGVAYEENYMIPADSNE